MVGRKIGVTRIVKMGQSHRITVPSDLVNFYNLEEGVNLEITFGAAFEDGDIIRSVSALDDAGGINTRFTFTTSVATVEETG